MNEYQKIEEYLTEKELAELEPYLKPFVGGFAEEYAKYSKKKATCEDMDYLAWSYGMVSQVAVDHYEREYLLKLVELLGHRLGVEFLDTMLYFQEKKGLKR